MEDKNQSIKDKLGGSGKSKIVIKKKTTTAETPKPQTTNKLDALIKEETSKVQITSPVVSAEEVTPKVEVIKEEKKEMQSTETSQSTSTTGSSFTKSSERNPIISRPQRILKQTDEINYNSTSYSDSNTGTYKSGNYKSGNTNPNYKGGGNSPNYKGGTGNNPNYKGSGGHSPNYKGGTGNNPNYKGGGHSPNYKGGTGNNPNYKGGGHSPNYKGGTGNNPNYKGGGHSPNYKGGGNNPNYKGGGGQGGFNRSSGTPGNKGDFNQKKSKDFGNQSGFTPQIEIKDGVQNRKRTTHNSNTFDKNKDRAIESQENIKFFKQMYKKSNLPPISGTTVPKEISIMENVQVGELAKKMNLKPNDVITKLMKMGMMVTINNVIDSDTAILLADEYGCQVKIVSLYEETVIQEEKDNPDDYITRPPVVTIMGHVDHGKTKLLDTIRKSAVIDTESGGITQHIGAYQVVTPRGPITFLDTPGHEAFTSMRARGAKVTDIVVLVVAADDGVKPQTIEAIDHAKAAEVPIIVAINKIDLPTANVDRVLQELSNLDLLPEEWGGKTITCKISARENLGIDKLLEMILIQAEVLDLKANPSRAAKGTIIEAKLDPGRGAIATVLIQNGNLKVGDPFLAGVHSGRVRAMFDDFGHSVEIAYPAFPVLVTGLEAVPDAGDPFDSMADEKEARNISQHRKEFQRIGQAASVKKVTLDNMNEIIQQGGLKELKIIIKTDVRGSAEAIKESLEKLSTNDIKLNVIRAGTGAIVDSDVMLASASNAIIVGFHVRANPRTLALSEKEGVDIKYYNIIYQVVDDIKAAMEGMLEPEKVEKVNGKLEVRELFKISKLGTIAGCMVTTGKITKNSLVRVFRDDVLVHEGKLKTLKRFKDDVTEVLTGFECGIMIDGFDDFIAGDEVEIYEINTVARKL
jgi:translation initiation factor IF-2